MKYRKIAKLGQGGMAQVSLAVSRGPAGFNKLLVLKELRPELAHDADFSSMFLDEARVSARLQHPNIVHIYDVVSEGDEQYLVMEYLQGQPLSKVRGLGEGKRFPLSLHLRALSDTLTALHYAHQLTDFDGHAMNLVHRDVSPQNVFVCYDGQVKLLDFGVAKVRGAQTQTAAGVMKGKLGYVAPEVLGGGGEIDRRADLFAVGVMLWEAIVGRRISSGKSDIEVAGARLTGNEPNVLAVDPKASPELAAICAKAMALASDDRYPTALAFKEALDKHIDSAATNAALAAFVSESFATDREEVSSVVKEYLGRPDNEETSLPSIQGPGEISSHSSVIVVPTMPTNTEPSIQASPKNKAVLFAVGGLLVAVAVVWLLLLSRTRPVDAVRSAAAVSAELPAVVAAPSAQVPTEVPSAAAASSAADAAALPVVDNKGPAVVAAGGSRVVRSPRDPQDPATSKAADTVDPAATGTSKKKEPRKIIENDPYGEKK